MTGASWGARFLEGTQGRIIVLLREGGQTVEELATALDLTPNAVRTQLATLDREGLVQVAGRRPGTRKPTLVHGLTPRAEQLLSRAYIPLLEQLLATLEGRLAPSERAAVLREAGRRLAAAAPRGSGTRRDRAELAARVLEELGGKVRVEQRGRSQAIVGSSCPLAAVVREHPEVCRAVEALVAEVTGLPAREQCDRTDRPRCTFVVG
jgi:predicted ArsR family transcriptional regulator